MKKTVWFRCVAAVAAFLVASMVTIRVCDRSPVSAVGRGVAVEVGVPEAQGLSIHILQDLITWFKGTVVPWVTGTFYAWVKSQVVGAINNKISETRDWMNSIYREGASIFRDAVRKARIFGGLDIGSGGYAYIEDIARATIKALDSSADSSIFSVFSSTSTLPSGNDGFVYFDVDTNQSLMEIARDLARRSESEDVREAAKWLGRHSPYAPTTLMLSEVENNVDKIKRDLTRYTRSLVGDPLEIETEIKDMSPIIGQHYLKETIRANAQKRLAVDVAAEAVADIHYSMGLERKLKDFEDSPEAASLTTAIKDLNRLIVLQTHVNTKILKQLAQQSLIGAEQVAAMGEQRAVDAAAVTRTAQVNKDFSKK
jgi:hypothetical protein